MNVIMYRFNGSSWVPMYPRTTINQVIGLNERLTNIQNQIDNLSPSGGGWTLLYSGSTTVEKDDERSIDLSNSISNGTVLAIEVRYGNTSVSYHSKIILTAIGNYSYTNTSSTFPRKIGFTEFDGEYFKNVYFVAYLYPENKLNVGHYSYLRGRLSPSSNTIEWSTNQSISVYITRIWKLV